MNKFSIKNNNGFTIVETLVAIAILMISIAGPLTVAQKGLMAALYARDQVTASFLAQETMETIKNLRDQYAIDPTKGFNTIGTGFIDKIVNTTSPCTTAPSLLKTDVNGRYGDIGNDSRFSRRYCFKTVNSNEITAVVKVTWQNGTIENEVVLENELFNITK